jgi:hypothetical protein
MKESEAGKKFLNGDEVVLGGVEVHVKFTRYQGNAGIQLDFIPPAGAGGAPQGIEDVNGRLAGLCRETVMNMEDEARLRLLALVEQDAGKDRMLYRLAVTSQIADGDTDTQVTDWIDPAFAALDAGAAGRAQQCRQTIEHLLDGAGGDEDQWQSEEMFEVLGTAHFPPAIEEHTEEEARRLMLEGGEFMLLEIQMVGVIGQEQGRNPLAVEFLVAMSKKALSSAWIKEKVRLLSKVCDDTMHGIDRKTTRHLAAAIRKTHDRERCLYRLSVWCSMNDNGLPQYRIRDQIDPVFESTDPAVGKRAAEARRLAGIVMGVAPLHEPPRLYRVLPQRKDHISAVCGLDYLPDRIGRPVTCRPVPFRIPAGIELQCMEIVSSIPPVPRVGISGGLFMIRETC